MTQDFKAIPALLDFKDLKAQLGVSGYEVVTNPGVDLPLNTLRQGIAYCSPGKAAIGGGSEIYDNDFIIVRWSKPVTDATGSEWAVGVRSKVAWMKCNGIRAFSGFDVPAFREASRGLLAAAKRGRISLAPTAEYRMRDGLCTPS